MPPAKKKTAPDRNAIITAFMSDTLESGHFPVSEYLFCKSHKMQESDFYKVFPSLAAVKKGIWKAFLDQTLELLEKDKQYHAYDNRAKMLAFFYAFFELLTLNRSYVLFALREDEITLKNMQQLSGLRAGFVAYAASLVEDSNESKSSRITQQSPKLYSEGAWLQMLFLLRFWIHDESAGFEQTDMAIEKSVNTIFDVFDNTPLESVLDFGKFLFKQGVPR